MSLQRAVKYKNIVDLYGEINKFERGCQARSNLVKDENGDLLADPHNILNGWKNYFSQLLKVHKISDIRQIETHTAKPLVPDPSPVEVEIVIAMFRGYKSPGSYQIPAESIQAAGEILRSEIDKLINSTWNKEELPDQCKNLLLYQFTRRAVKLNVVIIVGYHCY
jgi:hypothetical protein